MGKISVLKSFLGDYKLHGGNYHFCCPNKDHPSHQGGDLHHKLAIETNKGVYHCWTCGIRGNIHKLIKKYGSNSLLEEYKDYSFFDDKDPDKVYCDFTLPYKFDNEIAKYKTQYDRLSSRIHKDAIDFYQPAVSSLFDNAPILPFRARDGTYHYWLIDNYLLKKPSKYVAAYYKEDGERYSIDLPNGFLNGWGIRTHLPLFLVEGWYDMASLWPYTNVEPLLGKTLRDELFWLILKLPFPIVYIMLDSSDRTAVQNMKKLKNKFLIHGKESEIIKLKNKETGKEEDPNEAYLSGSLDGILRNHLNADRFNKEKGIYV